MRAIVFISGPLSSVTNLRANISSGSSVNISWTAPWFLDVTGVDHDIWYSVLIQNVTDEDRPTDILCTDCTNITETHYTFTPDHLSPCHVYSFTIIPANGAGLGERSICKFKENFEYYYAVNIVLAFSIRHHSTFDHK